MTRRSSRWRECSGWRVVVAAAVLALGGCGFHPVYGSGGGVASGSGRELTAIDVSLIPERAGQLLRQALQQRLAGTGYDVPAKRYQLVVSFGIATAAIGEQADSSVTRLREFGTANWTLKRLDPGQSVVTSGVARSLDGVNVIDEQYFASDIAGETANRRIADNIADEITLQLAAYFNLHPPATTG